MGIKQFFQMFNGNEITIGSLKGQTIAVDAMTEIYRASIGIGVKLTDSDGKTTNHINVLLNSIMSFINNDVKLIWVFDSHQPNPHKMNELNRRNRCKDQAEKSGKDVFRVTDDILRDVKYLLNGLDVEYIIAPNGFDAEHICAIFNRDGKVDHVLTTDADAFMYGANSVLKYEKRKLINYTRSMIKDQLKVITNVDYTNDQLLQLGVCMGTDYCEKTKGLGKATVARKCLTAELTSEQKMTIDIFKSSPKQWCHVDTTDTNGPQNRVELFEWLISRSFSRPRMLKLLDLNNM